MYLINELPRADGSKVSSASNDAANSNLSAETLLTKGAYEEALVKAKVNIAANSDDAHAFYIAARLAYVRQI